jgi:hypothetical protein
VTVDGIVSVTVAETPNVPVVAATVIETEPGGAPNSAALNRRGRLGFFRRNHAMD